MKPPRPGPPAVPPPLPKAVRPPAKQTLTGSPAVPPPAGGSWSEQTPDLPHSTPPEAQRRPSVAEPERHDTWPAERPTEARRRRIEERVGPVEYPPSRAPVSSGAARERFAVRALRWLARKLWAWLLPLVLSVAGSVGGWIWGYVKGMQAAVERVARIEAEAKREAQKRAAVEGRVGTAEGDLDRVFNVQRDHETRIKRLETERKQSPLVVTPAP